MTTKHTPTPWSHTGNAAHVGTAAIMTTCKNPYDQRFADAAFIVRAVNHHDALVAMVRELSTALLEATPSGDDASTRLAARADMLILPFLIEAA